MSQEPEIEPEILDEAAITDDERAIAQRGGVDLMQLPRLLGGALTDLRTIAEGMAVLPKLLFALSAIDERVESLDAEVKRMRAAVESMGGDVEEVRSDVSRVSHPLRRRNP